MFRKILFGIIVSAISIGGIYWFFYTKEARTPISEGINAIPTDAAIIFESKQSKNTWKKLSQTNIMWEELLSTETITKLNQQATFIDSIIETAPEISELLENHSVYISAHSTSKNNFDFLFVYSLPNLTYQSSLEEYFDEKINHKRETNEIIDFEGEKIKTLSPTKNCKTNYSIVNGILILSSNLQLLQTSVHQLKSGISISKDSNFSKVINTAGKNVDANIYVNYKRFPELLHPLLFTDSDKYTNSLSVFADCSDWDINIKPNALSLSGFTQASDSSNTFFNLFTNQKPQEVVLTSIIPANTATFLFLGISNVKSFYQNYRQQLKAKHELEKHEAAILEINKIHTTDIEEKMLNWMDNEMAIVITEPSENDFTNNSYAIIRSNNIDDAVNTLNDLTAHEESTENKKDSTYKGHAIGKIDIPFLMPTLFGSPFEKISNNYFTSIHDYIIFANTGDALKNFIDAFESNSTLANNKNFKAFSENMSAESNVYLYNAIARSEKIYSAFLKEDLAKEVELKKDLLKKFESIGIQFSSNNKLFYSTIYLKYNPEQKQETGTLWETKLDAPISNKPFLLINHKTKAKDVFVQDEANKIYLISNTGKIIWTKQLPEKIMSEVIQIDVLKNDKLQMLFNTRSSIYLFDRNGNDMEGFPIKLRSPATNAISIVDYEKNRDYRIFIATENKRIVCYKANGEQVTAFAFDKTEEQVFVPLQYFNVNNKDHLCAIDNKGKIYILDRRGATRVNIREKMEQGIRNFYIDGGKDYSKSYIIAADTLGNVIKISLSNNKERIKIQDFETSPHFDLKDINNDKSKEYIFLTRNELKVFSQDKSLLFKYEFENNITQTPQFFLFPDSKGKIGVASEESNEIYLFNDNGSLYNSFPINGKTAFSIGDLNNEGYYNLVTGSSENSIFVYQLK
ncbi:MAG: hypothetical protein NTX97_12195 [Bacteroidetes bacterium]|nr:hypothetical protein [Bacteroidota bacterium]